MITRRAWGRMLIDDGRVRIIADHWQDWRGKSAHAFARAYAGARIERLEG